MENGITITMAAEHNNNITTTIKAISRQLFSFIKQRVDRVEDAEDILQDVLFQFAGNVEPIEQASSWLYKVARNKITDSYRKQKLPLVEDILGKESADEESFDWKELIAGENTSPETTLLRNIFWEELQLALDEIPAEQRRVFIQHEIEGQSFQELSEITGVNIATLISRKRYAVLHLRERLAVLKEELLGY
ncbi:MAG TPA: RNA polymerase sigma factor [Ferruginibacter sp.]|nr:RNA polymerase sigma factor [Ferruginibacter sp.]